MAGKERKDSKGRRLKDNELQRKDGSYMYRYKDSNGILKTEYSWKLVATDKVPKGKRDGLSLREKEENIKKDQYLGLDSSLKKKTTLNQYIESYIDYKKYLWKNSTYVNSKYLYEKWIKNAIGKRKIADIQKMDIRKFYYHLIDQKGLKPNSLENINILLQPVFDLAIEEDIIRKNPCKGIMVDVKQTYHWEKPKRHALTEEQQVAFINHLVNTKRFKMWAPMFIVFLGTGCRMSELIGLRWQDIDLEENVININHNLIYGKSGKQDSMFYLETPKTKSGIRNIPMLSTVKEAILKEKEYQQKMGFWQKDFEIQGTKGWIFKNIYGKPHTPNSLNRIIKKAVDSYNEMEIELAKEENREAIQLPYFSVHNLRHTFASRLCEAESNLKVIQEVMGHSDIQVTMNVYAEATEKMKKKVFHDLENKIRII